MSPPCHFNSIPHQKNPAFSTKSLLDKNKTLSVNQTMAQIKITEMWKSVNTKNNPLHFKPKTVTENERTTRSITNGMMETHSLRTQNNCGTLPQTLSRYQRH